MCLDHTASPIVVHTVLCNIDLIDNKLLIYVIKYYVIDNDIVSIVIDITLLYQ